MCEILFRGKRKDNGEWIYGDLRHISDWKGGYNLHIVDNTNGRNNSVTGLEIIPETVGQYIGQPDKNGKKIFEGDIVKTKYGRICKVVWFAPQLCWDLVPLECKSKVPDQYDLFDSKNLEVIGNIYVNSAEKLNT